MIFIEAACHGLAVMVDGFGGIWGFGGDHEDLHIVRIIFRHLQGSPVSHYGAF